ncbi:MAG: transposase [Planctomycetota bacterium]
MSTSQRGHLGGVGDLKSEFVRPCLTPAPEDASRRDRPLRTLSDAGRRIVRTGCPWRRLPRDSPPYQAVYEQAQRWQKACVFREMAHELRIVERSSKTRAEDSTAAILDARAPRNVLNSSRSPAGRREDLAGRPRRLRVARGGWLAMMNGCRRPGRAVTGSRSSAFSLTG